jgi:hypothetical protein
VRKKGKMKVFLEGGRKNVGILEERLDRWMGNRRKRRRRRRKGRKR